jgi:hypothetical protein
VKAPTISNCTDAPETFARVLEDPWVTFILIRKGTPTDHVTSVNQP